VDGFNIPSGHEISLLYSSASETDRRHSAYQPQPQHQHFISICRAPEVQASFNFTWRKNFVRTSRITCTHVSLLNLVGQKNKDATVD
jgi:hypothetical protein